MNQDTDLFTKNKNNKSTSISYGRMLWGLLLPFIFITISLTLPIKSLYALPVLTIIFLLGVISKSKPKLGMFSDLLPKKFDIPSNKAGLKTWSMKNRIVILFVYFVVVVLLTVELLTFDILHNFVRTISFYAFISIPIPLVDQLFGVYSVPINGVLAIVYNLFIVSLGFGMFHGITKNNTISSGIKYSILFPIFTTLLMTLQFFIWFTVNYYFYW